MLQPQLRAVHGKGRALQEEGAEALHLLAKRVAVAPDLDGLCRLQRRQQLAPAQGFGVARWVGEPERQTECRLGGSCTGAKS